MLLTLGLLFEASLKLLVRQMFAVLLVAQSDVAVDVDDKYMCEIDFHMSTHSFLDTEL